MGALRDAGVQGDRICQVGAGHESGDERHSSRVKNDVQSGSQSRADEHVPYSNGAGGGQKSQPGGDEKIPGDGQEKELSAVDKIGERSAEEADNE